MASITSIVDVYNRDREKGERKVFQVGLEDQRRKEMEGNRLHLNERDKKSKFGTNSSTSEEQAKILGFGTTTPQSLGSIPER